ncbi:MAG: NAD(P)H-dependent oxidoreductase [Gammaproteobacteria bacterium]
MTRIVALSGSLRRGSLNTALVNAAHDLFPDQVQVATVHGIPLYDGDLEDEHGIPEAVEELKERIAGSDGLLIASPEYNNSVPGVLKNAMDWLTRPSDDVPRVWHGLPVAVTGATPGGFGTTLAQTAWLPVLRTLNTRPWFEGRLMVSRAHESFASDGTLADDGLRDRLRKFVQGFLDFAGRADRPRST